MCRITGILDLRNHSSGLCEHYLTGMRDSMAHGGPDSEGNWIEGNVGLAHRRLSILDLSDAGRQPMEWGDWVIAYNGEIYNFLETQSELRALGYEFSSNSDTEVIIKAFNHWGYSCVHKFRGMFAFALWNKKEKKIILCRDRVGVKPLFWYFKNGLFLFSSEIKAFHKHPDFDSSVNNESVSYFLSSGYIPESHSIFTNVHKLSPGHFLTIDQKSNIDISKYWEASKIYLDNEVIKTDFQETSEHLEKILLESFKLRMVADVPVGLFLSGGIDSSLIAALLTNSGVKLKTFTIGFSEKEYDESIKAQKIANHLSTEHTTYTCTSSDLLNVANLFTDIYDEPFGDDSVIPTLLVSKLASKSVKVCLSGDGGDELFGGYTKYEFSKYFDDYLNKIPNTLKKATSNVLGYVNTDWVNHNSSYFPFTKRYTQAGNKLLKFKKGLAANSTADFFQKVSQYSSIDELKFLFSEPNMRISSLKDFDTMSFQPSRLLSGLGVIDIQTYLVGDILTKVDRATMANALEGREPFLDHKIIEFALTLPDKYKINKGITKYILRNILDKYVPNSIMAGAKYGFTIPIEAWLKKDWQEDLISLTNDMLFLSYFNFNSKEIRKVILSFLDDKNIINPKQIWFLFVLYKWYHRWIRK